MLELRTVTVGLGKPVISLAKVCTACQSVISAPLSVDRGTAHLKEANHARV